MTDRLLGILRYQRFELGFGLLVFEMGRPGSGKDARKLRPGIGCGHIHNPHRLKPRLRRLDPKELGFFAGFDAAPELALGSHDQMLVERIGMGDDLDPFAAAGDH